MTRNPNANFAEKVAFVTGAASWLGLDAAAFMVGHALVMDGGQTVQ